MNVFAGRFDALPESSSFRESLRKIEQLQQDIRVELAALRTSVNNHVEQDRGSFEIIGKTFISVSEDITKRLETQDQKRKNWFNALDAKVEQMRREGDRAKGAGWVILGLLGAVATVLGGVAISVIDGLLKH